jgi:hypothetical protein
MTTAVGDETDRYPNRWRAVVLIPLKARPPRRGRDREEGYSFRTRVKKVECPLFRILSPFPDSLRSRVKKVECPLFPCPLFPVVPFSRLSPFYVGLPALGAAANSAAVSVATFRLS